jgi:hypothetical protein
MRFLKFFYFKIRENLKKYISKFFPKAKKFRKCVPKYLIKGKNENPKSRKEIQGGKRKIRDAALFVI